MPERGVTGRQLRDHTSPEFGMAAVWDADTLTWASRQITEAFDRDIKRSKTVRFHPHNPLRSIRRPPAESTTSACRPPLSG